MTEVFEHNPDDHEDPSAGPTWVVGFVGVVLLVAIIPLLAALYYNAKSREREVRVVRLPVERVARLHEEQAARLAGPPRWVERDEAGETVRAFVIPVERAMELVVEEAAGAGP